MNPERIKAEIRKLNWIDKIGIYRWIDEEVAGDRGIGTNRSLQIRQEIERIARFPDQAREQEFIDQQTGSLLLLSFPSCKTRNDR